MNTNIAQLEQTFISGKLSSIPQSMVLHGISYKFSKHSPDTWESIITGQKKAITIFTLDQNAKNVKQFDSVKASSPDDYNSPQTNVALVWGVSRTLGVIPAAAKFIPKTRQLHVTHHGITEQTDISYSEPVVITNINNNQPFDAKIDTGADMCSLHADSIEMGNGTVSFSINGRMYRMPITDTKEIKQADSDAQARPVVTFTFQIGDQTIDNVQCNLNDRSGMDSPLLIGKNLLSRGDFVIRTQVSESVESTDWDYLQSLFEHIDVPNVTLQPNFNESVDRLVEIMLNNNITLSDVLSHVKQHTILDISESVEY